MHLSIYKTKTWKLLQLRQNKHLNVITCLGLKIGSRRLRIDKRIDNILMAIEDIVLDETKKKGRVLPEGFLVVQYLSQHYGLLSHEQTPILYLIAASEIRAWKEQGSDDNTWAVVGFRHGKKARIEFLPDYLLAHDYIADKHVQDYQRMLTDDSIWARDRKEINPILLENSEWQCSSEKGVVEHRKLFLTTQERYDLNKGTGGSRFEASNATFLYSQQCEDLPLLVWNQIERLPTEFNNTGKLKRATKVSIILGCQDFAKIARYTLEAFKTIPTNKLLNDIIREQYRD